MLFFFVGAVRRNHLSSKASDADVNLTIANWLRFAKDRDGGRREKERRKMKAEALRKSYSY